MYGDNIGKRQVCKGTFAIDLGHIMLNENNTVS